MRFRHLLLAIAPLFALRPSASEAGNEIKLVVLREKGVGTAAQAQPILDRFMALAKGKVGWAAARGTYFSDRKAAEAYLDAEKPQFAILTLPAFLALHGPRALETIGQARVARAGGRTYHLVSKSASDLAACKKKKLASDHLDDARFVEKVVARGAFVLADFQVEITKRPLQAMKQVIRGESACALIDDAQLAELAHVEGGKELRKVWSSVELPPMAVVALGTASAAEKAGLRGALASLCQGDGKATCSELGVESLTPATNDAYADVLAKYGAGK